MKELTEAQTQAYAFVDKMVPRADGNLLGPYPYWHGWALREAFEAGWKARGEADAKAVGNMADTQVDGDGDEHTSWDRAEEAVEAIRALDG